MTKRWTKRWRMLVGMGILGILALVVAAGLGLSPPTQDPYAESGWQYAWSWTVGTVLEPRQAARPAGFLAAVEQIYLRQDGRTMIDNATHKRTHGGTTTRGSFAETVYAYPLLC